VEPNSAEAHYNLGNAFAKRPDGCRTPSRSGKRRSVSNRTSPRALQSGDRVFAILEPAGGSGCGIQRRAPHPSGLRRSTREPGQCAVPHARRLPEAIAQYEQAVRLRPDLGEVHYRLGMVLLQIPGPHVRRNCGVEYALRVRPDPRGSAWSTNCAPGSASRTDHRCLWSVFPIGRNRQTTKTDRLPYCAALCLCQRPPLFPFGTNLISNNFGHNCPSRTDDPPARHTRCRSGRPCLPGPRGSGFQINRPTPALFHRRVKCGRCGRSATRWRKSRRGPTPIRSAAPPAAPSCTLRRFFSCNVDASQTRICADHRSYKSENHRW